MLSSPRDRTIPSSSASPDDVPDVPDVALVSWPQDEALRRRLAAARRPRLLLIDGSHAAPLAADELEDWVRYPLDPDELAIRIATLVHRASGVAPRATTLVLDDDGVLHADDRWVALSLLEARLLAALLERPGELVHRPTLVRTAWPDGAPADERALDGVLKRLRRRVAPLGVRIHTVNGLGLLLEYTPDRVPIP
ncbi:MAG TPA: winged helix-turn-helix domain-containing protein [Acidimicrobiales bacterium]|nr:winged helix-turn-helix domain-containing protein [Acidimicrobiales bacterium]